MCIVFTNDVVRIILKEEGFMYKLNYKFLQILLRLLLDTFTNRMANVIFFTVDT